MLLKDFLPKPENRHLVRLYRIVHFDFGPNSSGQTKVYPPRPEHTLCFFPREPEQVEYPDKKKYKTSSIVTGQHDLAFSRTCKNDFLGLQVVFQPTGLYSLTGIPSTELCNQYVDAELLFSTNVRLINEQLYHAQSYDEMLAIAERFVSTLRIKKTMTSISPVSQLLLQKDGISLDWLAKESSLSIRQFERCFRLQTGVSPKLFSRITRFDKAFRMKNQYPTMDWLSIAVSCGYYDYQHLVKDYKDFTGLTPPAFHNVENTAPERLFGLHEDFYDTRLE
jgi:AraC-like DNA-binding protein